MLDNCECHFYLVIGDDDDSSWQNSLRSADTLKLSAQVLQQWVDVLPSFTVHYCTINLALFSTALVLQVLHIHWCSHPMGSNTFNGSLCERTHCT